MASTVQMNSYCYWVQYKNDYLRRERVLLTVFVAIQILKRFAEERDEADRTFMFPCFIPLFLRSMML